MPTEIYVFDTQDGNITRWVLVRNQTQGKYWRLAIHLSLSFLKQAVQMSFPWPRTTQLQMSGGSFDPALANADGRQEGKLLIKSSNSKYKVSIPWQAQVLKGGLTWNANASKFLLSDHANSEDQVGIMSPSRKVLKQINISYFDPRSDIIQLFADQVPRIQSNKKLVPPKFAVICRYCARIQQFLAKIG